MYVGGMGCQAKALLGKHNFVAIRQKFSSFADLRQITN